MENLKSTFVNNGNLPSECANSVQGFNSELTPTLERLTIDVNGIVKELHKTSKRDTERIRQDFIRNGIDSGIVTPLPSNQQPGISQWPLISLENQSVKRLPPFNRKTPLRADASQKPVTSTRCKLLPKGDEDHCVFCYNNREEQETYTGHSCRDENGLVVCPKLRNYVCPYCRATGDMAHTKKYCPKKPIITPDDLQTMVLPFVGQNGSRRNRNHNKKSLRF